MENLIKKTRLILAANPDCFLSGSLALSLQGFNIRRDPEDLDFYTRSGFIISVPGMMDFEDEDERYVKADDPAARVEYLFDEVKVDFFRHANINEQINYSVEVLGIRMLHWTEILKFKISYCQEGSSTKEKHSEDIIYFLKNN